MLPPAISIARTRELRPYAALIALSGFSLALGLGLELRRHLHFTYHDDSGVVGWVHAHAYPKQQELVWYVLALAGPPLVIALGWLAWIAGCARAARGTGRPLERLLKRTALASLPMLLVWVGVQRLDRSPVTGLGLPVVLTLAAVVIAVLLPAQGVARADSRAAAAPPPVPEPPRSRARSLLSLAVAYVVLPVLLYPSLVNGNIHGRIDLFHEGERLAPLNAMLHGGVPYRDAYLQHGLIQNACLGRLASALFGPTLEATRTLQRLVEPLGPLALYLLGLQVFRGGILTALVLVVVAAGRHVGVSERQALGLISLALVASYVNRRGASARASEPGAQPRREEWSLVLAGLSASAAFWYSTEVGLYTIAAIGAFLLLYGTWSPGGGARVAARMLACAGLGLALGLGLVGVWLLANGALDDALRNTYAQVAYQMDTWGLAFYSLPTFLAPLVDGGPLAGLRPFVLSEAFRWYLPILVLVGAGAYLTHRLLAGDLWRSEACAKLLLLFLAGTVSFRTALGRSDGLHMEYGAATAWLLLLLLVDRGLAGALDRLHSPGLPWRERARSSLAHAWVLLPAAGLSWYALEVYHSEPPKETRPRWSALFERGLIQPAASPTSLPRAGRIDIPPAQEEQIRAVVEYIRANTAEGEAIFDFTNQGGYFFFADRPSATRYFQIVYAATPALQQEVIEALERERTRLVLYSTKGNYGERFDGVSNEERNPLIAAYLAKHYEPAASIKGTELWRRRQ